MSCGASHPNYGEQVLCEEGNSEPNAESTPVYQFTEWGSVAWDEEGNQIILVPSHPVHVHKGYLRDEEDTVIEVCRWEDAPDPE